MRLRRARRPVGPAERKREPVVIAARGGPEIVGDLVVQDCGFNLHAKTRASALDDEARVRSSVLQRCASGRGLLAYPHIDYKHSVLKC